MTLLLDVWLQIIGPDAGPRVCANFLVTKVYAHIWVPMFLFDVFACGTGEKLASPSEV